MYEDELAVAQEAARRAGSIMQERANDDHDVQRKSSHTDIVTEVDHLCQDTILETIQDRFPDAEFLAEEDGVTPEGTRYWVVDPVDATSNYHHGFPVYCTSIALVEDGETLLGVVLDPVRDELFHAVKGEGAFLNGEPIQVSGIDALTDALVITRIADRAPTLVEKEAAFITDLVQIPTVFRRMGCAALALSWVAAGRAEAYALASIHEWDIAAGRRILKEAGGAVRQQEAIKEAKGETELVATNGGIHAELTELFDQYLGQ